MASANKGFLNSLIVPSRMIFIMWLIFFIQANFEIDLLFLGILPRKLGGLMGIITAPVIHVTYFHLISNTLPILVLGTLLYFAYPALGNQVFLRCYLFTNILVWVFGRQAYHIGASGVVYGIASFLILFGLFKRDFRSLLVSAIVIVIYGSIFYNTIPESSLVSWEAHLLGIVTGAVTAYEYRRKKY